MGYCAKEASARGIAFERFALADMRPTAVTDRVDEGDDRIVDATGHADERMVRKVRSKADTEGAFHSVGAHRQPTATLTSVI